MQKTLLQIGQAVAIKTGLEVPTTLRGNSERTARLIYQSIEDGTSKDAFRDFDWAALRDEHSFTTTGAEYYNLPPMFDRIINDTIWDRTNGRKVIGPVPPDKWQVYYSGLTGLTGLSRICRITGQPLDQTSDSERLFYKRLRIYPDEADATVPNSAADPITIAFEYISTRFIANVGKVGFSLSDEWSSDSDISLIDADVIEAAAVYRLLRTLGMSYSDEEEEYNALIAERGARDSGAETLNMVPTRITFAANTPDTGYGS